MKPEDRAVAAIGHGIDMLELMNAISRAIYDAIIEEREACAQIAESFIPSGFTGNYGIARDDRARTIAHAIRARSEA